MGKIPILPTNIPISDKKCKSEQKPSGMSLQKDATDSEPSH